MSESLKFLFTPVDGPNPRKADNPHAKASTEVDNVIAALRAKFGEAIQDTVVYAGERTVFVAKDKLVEVCTYLKSEQGFNYLVDIIAIDRFTEDDRFEVAYNLVAIYTSKRLRVQVRIDEDDLEVDTVTGVWRAATWYEREAFDMMGIRFKGHPDLRRMFLPEDFEYYPQRKEFPLLGIPGSLPLPAQTPEGPLGHDPFVAARGSATPKSYQEPTSSLEQEED